MRLLLIEADPLSGKRLAEGLGRNGFVPKRVTSFQQALREREDAGVIVFDAGLSAVEVETTVRSVRSICAGQPFIVLAARGDWREKVACLDAGADDYLQKPVRSEEITARLRVIIRRSAGCSTDRIISDGLALDLKARCAWLDGCCLDLTHSEFRLLRLFMLSPGHILTHAEIWQELHPTGEAYSANAVEVQVARLRQKVGRDRIRTIRSAGYRMVPAEGDDGRPLKEMSPCMRTCSAPCAC